MRRSFAISASLFVVALFLGGARLAAGSDDAKKNDSLDSSKVKLLADPNPEVRLGAALALAEAQHVAAIPVLIDLLTVLPASKRGQVEEVLQELAGEWAPTELVREDKIALRIYRDAWAGWWDNTNGPALLAMLKKLTPTSAELDQVKDAIKRLGAENFTVREKAVAELVAKGRMFLPLLREGSRNAADLETRARLQQCIKRIEAAAVRPLPGAAFKLLGMHKPAGAAEALLAYLPLAEAETLDEVQPALNALAVRDGKAEPALVRALSDTRPVVRAAAALALAPHDRRAVPVLIELIAELSGERAEQIHDLLSGLAGAKAPPAPADNAVARKQASAAWAAWWREHGAKVDLAKLLAPQQSQPRQLPREIVTAWEKAGAKAGLVRPRFLFNTSVPPRLGDMPEFYFKWREGVIATLPAPVQPFGLDLSNANVTDAALKELAGLTSLQSLGLIQTQVTDAGLKELAGLRRLRNLDLYGTRVTDVGLKALAGLKSLESLVLGNTHVTGLKEPAGFKSLQSLNLQFTQVTDDGLKELGRLKSLQSLNLWNTKVTDAGLKHLIRLKKLRALDLRGTKVTDAGLKELTGLHSLQELAVGGTQVTDVGLKELAGLENLQWLSLGVTSVTDAGLKELAGLKNLQSLNLGSTKVTGAGLKELAGLKSLQWLSLYEAPLTDARLKEVAGLKSVQSLELIGTPVTDAGLKELAGLKSLRMLHVERTKVTAAGVNELKKALPRCFIYR